MNNKKPVLAFSALCAAAVVAVGGYLYHAKQRLPPTDSADAAAHPPAAAPASTPTRPAPTVASASSATGRLFFRHTGMDEHYGQLAWREAARGGEAHFVAHLRCEVAHVSGGRGMCLTAERGVVTTYSAKLFDATTFAVTAELPLQGIPSRTRVSRDGRLAAYTVFAAGHGYTSLDFATRTVILDTATGRELLELENLAITKDGQPFKAKDFNFWGVTFTPDGKNFFATLSSGGQHYLLRGDIARRSATVLHDNVECPSVSPDATRVAYKKRYVVDGRIVWQFHVLDLKTLVETPLAEKRNVDDQIEWLDDAHVLYALASDSAAASTDVWTAPIDGKGAPSLYLRNAYSPATERFPKPAP
ncbi:hypothetical protein [Azohydromonas lata]|uniref:hypothetical protein n=1 Tax=Azohydromonas lata TaxID=45677 RepID=UPI00082A0D66|nr:hypothetical protein [Azohydromonas lata]